MSTQSYPPRRIVVGYLKGGTGKTTTAVLIALALAAGGDSVALLDTDQANETATLWAHVAGDEWPATVTVERWRDGSAESAAAAAARLARSHRHLVVDTGPGGRAILADVLTVGRDLICPVLASPAEVMSLRPTLEVAAHAAQAHDVRLHVPLTKIRARSVHRREAREHLEDMGLPVLVSEVALLDRYQDAPGTVPDDVGEYADVLTEVIAREGQA